MYLAPSKLRFLKIPVPGPQFSLKSQRIENWAWCTNQFKRSLSISVKCRIWFVADAQNEPFHRIKL